MKLKEFLDFLEEEEVHNKIKTIVQGEESGDTEEAATLKKNNVKLEELVKSLEDDKEMFEKLKAKLESMICKKDEDIESLTKNSEQKESEIKSHNTTIDSLNSQIHSLKSKNSSLDKELRALKNSFEADLSIFAEYEKLADSTKKSISNIFKDDSLNGFFACGVQEKNIISFWEYIKLEVINNKNRDIEKLNKIFDYLFEKYRLAYPMYERQNTNINDVFDTQLQIKHNSSSNTSGKIKDILLKGYVNTKTDKVMKHSVVVL